MAKMTENDRMKKMEDLLREMRQSYIGDAKGQSDIETDWCSRIDVLLGEEPCGLFTLDFDGRVRTVPRAGDCTRVEMDFDSPEEAELAIEQLAALLRGMDELREIANTPVDQSYSQHERFLNLCAKLEDLRHGEVR